MPKQKSNALVVYSGATQPVSPAKGQQEEIKAMIAKAIETLKKQMAMPRDLKGVPPYAAMMADPFSGPLVPRPDSSNSPSNCYRLVDVYDVTANASGAFFAGFVAGLNSSAYVTPTFTGTTLTAVGTASTSQYYTSLSTDNTSFRTLVYAVQFIPTANDNVAQGAIHIGLYPGSSLTSALGTLGDVSTLLDDPNGVLGAADQRAIAISRPYISPFMSSMNAQLAGNFPAIVFVGSGLPTTSSGKLVVTRLVECEPITGNIPSMTAKRTPSDPIAVSCGDNIMGSAASYAVGDGCDKKVLEAGKKLAAASAADLANYQPNSPMARVRQLLG